MTFNEITGEIVETLESVTVLGITIIIRTFLSLTLEVEIEGMLPWRRNEPGAAPSSDE